MSKLKLTLACGDYDFLRPLINAEIQPQGIELNVLTMPSPERHGRMAGRTRSTTFSRARVCSRWGRSNANSGPVKSCSRRLDRITASPTVVRKSS